MDVNPHLKGSALRARTKKFIYSINCFCIKEKPQFITNAVLSILDLELKENENIDHKSINEAKQTAIEHWKNNGYK